MVNENEKCCGFCAFYDKHDGRCHRFPPQICSDVDSEYTGSCFILFPQVSQEDWCGEFKEQSNKTFLAINPPSDGMNVSEE